MPKPTGIALLVSLHRRGVLPEDWVVDALVERAAEGDVDELIAALPPDLRASLRRAVDEAPVSDDEWDRTLRIVAGTFSYPPDHDEPAVQAQWRATRRAGVEALRAYFGREAPVRPGENGPGDD